uniref:Uncharacterized protein n=1 Tax=Rhizophora mucronata TaxID=61149 RepID=A0A2P2QA20_RHIMU
MEGMELNNNNVKIKATEQLIKEKREKKRERENQLSTYSIKLQSPVMESFFV